MSDLDVHRRLVALERAVDDLRAREQGATPFHLRFTALKTVAQTIPANAFTVVTWPAIIEDAASAYDSSTHTLTLPAGWYICACVLFWMSSAQANQEYIMSLDRNGSRWRDGERQVMPSVGRSTGLASTWLIPGGAYRVLALHGPGTAAETITGTGPETWWHVWRVA